MACNINCNYVLRSGPISVLQRLANKHGVPVRFTSSGRGDAADLYLGSCLHLLQVVIHLLEETECTIYRTDLPLWKFHRHCFDTETDCRCICTHLQQT